jgi:hypothetical protein
MVSSSSTSGDQAVPQQKPSAMAHAGLEYFTSPSSSLPSSNLPHGNPFLPLIGLAAAEAAAAASSYALIKAFFAVSSNFPASNNPAFYNSAI